MAGAAARLVNLAWVLHLLTGYVSCISITVIENPVYAVLGESCYLWVNATLTPQAEIQWIFGSTSEVVVLRFPDIEPAYPVEYAKRAELYTNNGTLRLDEVRLGDQGKYTLSVKGFSGTLPVTSSATIDLVVLDLLDITMPSTLVKTTSGGDLQLDCPVSANPPASRNWTKGLESFVTSEQNKYQLLPNGSLLIKNLTPVDSGFYGCEARNVAGRRFKGLTLLVQSYPDLVAESCGVDYVLISCIAVTAALLLLSLSFNVYYCLRKKAVTSKPPHPESSEGVTRMPQAGDTRSLGPTLPPRLGHHEKPYSDLIPPTNDYETLQMWKEGSSSKDRVNPPMKTKKGKTRGGK
ncbi:tyrosine-protein kinase-like otk isoform X2 [Lissotriton helveticus]